MILRDRDANTAWESQADGTLEERVYSCQNWRADVVALMTDGGELINQVRYDPYGVPFGIAKTDLDADGDVDGDDYTQFSTYYSAGTMPYADWNWDGTKDTADITAYLNDKNADTGLGRGDPSYAYGTEGGANRKAYAGYEIEPVLTGGEGWESVYHVRNRVLLSQNGRWTRRDPLGYVDGMSVYAYASSWPLLSTDPTGTTECPKGVCAIGDSGPCRTWCCRTLKPLLDQLEIGGECREEINDALDECCGGSQGRSRANCINEIFDQFDDCFGELWEGPIEELIDKIWDELEDRIIPPVFGDCFSHCDAVFVVNSIRCVARCRRWGVAKCLGGAYANLVGCYACCAPDSDAFDRVHSHRCADESADKMGDTFDLCLGKK